jgi:hypothetical protein
MTLVPAGANGPNKTLKGHKLLILSSWPLPPGYIESLQKKHSDIQVVYHKVSQDENGYRNLLPDKEWKDVTILLGGELLPRREVAPKLEYVQVTSAGADHILKEPLFLNTDVTFCTANGVHG